MLIYLYDCTDSNNTINKNKENRIVKDVALKNNVNIKNPVIKLKSETPIENNYCYIPDFNRFYFIEDVTFLNKEVQELYLKCDVLESFKDDILSSEVVITKTTEDNYLPNGRLNTEEREAFIYKGDNIDYKDNIILVAIR